MMNWKDDRDAFESCEDSREKLFYKLLDAKDKIEELENELEIIKQTKRITLEFDTTNGKSTVMLPAEIEPNTIFTIKNVGGHELIVQSPKITMI